MIKNDLEEEEMLVSDFDDLEEEVLKLDPVVEEVI